MFRTIGLWGVLGVLFICGGAQASSLTGQHSSFWVLGDSLSAFDGPPGGAATLRASDGPLWSEQIIGDFAAAGKTAQSFAAGGATAGLNRSAPTDLTTDLTGQVDRLLAQSALFGADPLVAIWIGGNDVPAFESGLSPTDSVAAYSMALTRLALAGVQDLLLFEVPDIGFTPLVRDGLPPAAADAASVASSGLNSLFFDTVVANLPGQIEVTIIDTFALTRTAYEDPAFFGLSSRGPCTTLTLPCSETSFWDPFHPSAALHDYVANEVRGAYAPVPLPAAAPLLLAGLGGLAVLRRRAG